MVLLDVLFATVVSAAEPEARVAVLQWKGTDTDHTDAGLRRKIAAQLDEADIVFIPDNDLAQQGRLSPDLERGSTAPSLEDVAQVMALVDETAAIPAESLTAKDWGKRALTLQTLTNRLWFIDREELRESTFLLYAQIGRAAELSTQESAPFHQEVDARFVNYYWYLAGVLADETPALLDTLTDAALRENIEGYRVQIGADVFRPLTLSFDLNDAFDGVAFVSEYSLFVNGLEHIIANVAGLLEVPLGISDIFLLRRDGSHGLSIRYERLSAEKGFEFPRQEARKRMGLDLIESLERDPTACLPTIREDLATSLAIYADLHPDATNYVAVPKFGKTSGKNLMLWRWDVENSQLVLVDPICEGVSK